MRYKQFLVQEKSIVGKGRSKDISKEQAIQLLEKNCSDALKAYSKGSIIQRGVRNDAKYISIDPKSGKPRKSANTSNYYTLMIDGMKSWDKYPKRSQSLICSTGDRSFGYGYMFHVFPYNGANIGVAPARDFWISFENIDTSDLSQFNNNIGTIMRMLHITISDKSYLDILNAFGKFDILIDNNEYEIQPLINGGIKWLKGYKGNLLQHMKRLLDPNKNGFKTYKIGDILPKDKEIWTDSKCVMISTKVLNDIGVL